MKKISLESLWLKVDVPNEFHYSWDGEVDDVYDHVTSLRHRYAEKGLFSQKLDKYPDIEKERKELGNNVNGSISRFYKFQLSPPPVNIDVFLHAYIRKGLPKNKALFVRGHEEAHVLYLLGAVHLLGRESDRMTGRNFLEKAFKMANSLADINLIETIANYGGRHALAMAAIKGLIDCSPKEVDDLALEMWGQVGKRRRPEYVI